MVVADGPSANHIKDAPLASRPRVKIVTMSLIPWLSAAEYYAARAMSDADKALACLTHAPPWTPFRPLGLISHAGLWYKMRIICTSVRHAKVRRIFVRHKPTPASDFCAVRSLLALCCF